jgi:hypothetical protein
MTVKKTIKKKPKKLDWEKRQQMGFDVIDETFVSNWAQYLCDIRNNTTNLEFLHDVNQTLYNFVITLTNLCGEMMSTRPEKHEIGAIIFRAALTENLQRNQFQQLVGMKKEKKAVKRVSKK